MPDLLAKHGGRCFNTLVYVMLAAPLINNSHTYADIDLGDDVIQQ